MGQWFISVLDGLGNWAAFSLQAIWGTISGYTRLREIVPIFFTIGVSSVTVMLVTGVFIGMVLAIQSYSQFHPYGLDSALGTISNSAILGELGPVLAAVMLAGRVGGSMAAELATMRVTEQIDALACLGVDPVRHLVTPRFLACVMLIPLLTVLADVAGIFGSYAICIFVYRIDSHAYWSHTLDVVGLWEVLTGLIKSIFFGALLSLISCYRGFRGTGGAQGVGRAATEAFVYSFLAILIVDFFLVFILDHIRPFIDPLRPMSLEG